jgi:hypothetical protein
MRQRASAFTVRIIESLICPGFIAGKMPADKATAALAVLTEHWTPQAQDNASWFEAMGFCVELDHDHQ